MSDDYKFIWGLIPVCGLFLLIQQGMHLTKAPSLWLAGAMFAVYTAGFHVWTDLIRPIREGGKGT
jgi:hypothetical protein